MLSLSEPVTLYHGSSVAVEHPDLDCCRPRKDFGRGFYLTSSREQAQSFARTVTRRENRRHPNSTQGYGMLSTYSFMPDNRLVTKVFPTANVDWLHCVAAHRGASSFDAFLDEYHNYDIIAGKVANDQTNATLLAYIGGLYGTPGNSEADEICVRLLMPERLDDQACFRTNRSLGCLSSIKSERVWL